MFVKLSFYYTTYDSAQNGVQVEKVTTNLWPVRRDASFKPQHILYQKHACLRRSLATKGSLFSQT